MVPIKFKNIGCLSTFYVMVLLYGLVYILSWKSSMLSYPSFYSWYFYIRSLKRLPRSIVHFLHWSTDQWILYHAFLLQLLLVFSFWNLCHTVMRVPKITYLQKHFFVIVSYENSVMTEITPIFIILRLSFVIKKKYSFV